MKKVDEYRATLRTLSEWDTYLLEKSGLPGPRGNIELGQVVADEGNLALYQRYLSYTADVAPTNSPYEFLAFCGVVGLGRLLAKGADEHLETLRRCASIRAGASARRSLWRSSGSATRTWSACW